MTRCNAVIDAVLPLSPDEAFDLLTDPEVKQWRQVKECTFRKVWEDDGNRQLVEVEQTSQVFFKTIRTRMNVIQDKMAGTMQFSLAKPGMLKICNGQWTVSAVQSDSSCSRVQLDQEMQPGFVPPPPFRRFMRKAMLGKAAQMLHQMREEATRIRTASCHEGLQQPSSAASLPSMTSLKLSSQKSFDIIAFSGAPKKAACTTGASAPIASHVLTFDDEESE
ncbi:g4562 [Coccomyxa elongata]